MTRHDAFEFIQSSHGGGHDCCDPITLNCAIDACCPSNDVSHHLTGNARPTYIAVNRFRVNRGSEPDFEAAWLRRGIHLTSVPGLVAFDLLKGPETDAHTLYASHTAWESEARFLDWRDRAAIREAHKDADRHPPFYEGSQKLEGFSSIQSFSR